MADVGYSMWHFLAALLKGEAFKRSPAKERTWPGLEVVGEEFSFYLEIPVVSGCQETPGFWGRGTCSPFWELTKTYLTPIDWNREQYNFEDRDEEKSIWETPRGTAVPALEHVVPGLSSATGRTNRCVRLLPHQGG